MSTFKKQLKLANTDQNGLEGKMLQPHWQTEKSFHIQFGEEYLTFFLQYSSGFKLYKRPVSNEPRNSFEWELEMDISD